MVLPGKRPNRLAAGDWRLRSRSTGSVLVTGVAIDPGVYAVAGLLLAVYGVDGAKMLFPPHL